MIDDNVFVEKEKIVNKAKSLFSELSASNDLSPSPHINKNFCSLVSLSVENNYCFPYAIKELEDEGFLDKIRQICAKGEMELEYFWCKKILSKKASIQDFPYYENYDFLTDFELKILSKYLDLKDKKMLYVGSGTLPLTVLMFEQKNPLLKITCIDCDKTAVAYSNRLFHSLGSHLNCLQFNVSDLGLSELNLNDFDLVFVGALVGESNKEKNEYLENLLPLLKPNCVMVVRSVPFDGRMLLYPKFILNDNLKHRCTVLGEFEPDLESGVINSLMVLSKMERVMVVNETQDSLKKNKKVIMHASHVLNGTLK
ncbi:MAG: hypothetical protein COV47_00570 [Candidatus Diapherotrites archaeon CG11_big_fil_rev_8_21_14_0_20_37_9]|nr:MAG: hypothetical protein COV47_00570 [Candidatus Diapherotrites archaeon CG11_big_fil_rev_8_21_14_0_20_37_9]